MKINENPEMTVKFFKRGSHIYAVNLLFGNTKNMLAMIPSNRIGTKYKLINHLKNGKPVEITVRALTEEELEKWKVKNKFG